MPDFLSEISFGAALQARKVGFWIKSILLGQLSHGLNRSEEQEKPELQKLRDAGKGTPLFLSAVRREKRLTDRGMHVNDLCRIGEAADAPSRPPELAFRLLVPGDGYHGPSHTRRRSLRVPLLSFRRVADTHARARTFYTSLGR